jgi:hypothetical protein
MTLFIYVLIPIFCDFVYDFPLKSVIVTMQYILWINLTLLIMSIELNLWKLFSLLFKYTCMYLSFNENVRKWSAHYVLEICVFSFSYSTTSSRQLFLLFASLKAYVFTISENISCRCCRYEWEDMEHFDGSSTNKLGHKYWRVSI